jgi:hypothetical protein
LARTIWLFDRYARREAAKSRTQLLAGCGRQRLMSESLLGAAPLFTAPAAVILIAATAYIGGRSLTQAALPVGGFEIVGLSLSAGLLLLAQLGLMLGLLGQLARGPVLATFLILHLIGYRAWRELTSAVGHVVRAHLGRLPRHLTTSVPFRAVTVSAPAAALLLTMALVPAALLAIYPPLGFDATMYHLPFAKAFAATHHLPFLPALRFPVFPQLNEILFAIALLLDSDLAAQLLMVLATLLTMALLVAWGRTAFSDRSAAGWLAAATLAGNPLVIYLAGSAYIDAGLALWVTAALYCLHQFRQSTLPAQNPQPTSAPARAAFAQDRPEAGAQRPTSHRHGVEGTDPDHPLETGGASIKRASTCRTVAPGSVHWLVLAGAFAGAAASSKYLGLFFVVAIGVVLAWRDRRAALWFASAAIAIAAPWYGRIIYYTNNPVFPYFPQWFGHSPWDPLLFRPVFSPAVWLRALDHNVLAFARLPWDLSLGWRSAGAIAPLSPAYLAALPLLAYEFATERRIRRLLLLAGAFALATLALPREPRYVVAALPLLSLATGAALARFLEAVLPLPSAARRRLAISLCVALLLPGWLYGAIRLRHLGLPPANGDQREAWLARRLPLYPALSFLNRSRGSAYSAYALHAENMKYFAEGTLLGDWTGPASFLLLPALDGDAEVLARALGRLGADCLILPASTARPGCSGGAAFDRHFLLLFHDSHACVFSLVGPLHPAS